MKWLPHFGDPRRQDAAGNARMVYSSVREFAAEQAELFAGRGSFTPRHASSSAQTPTPHPVIIADVGGSPMGVRDQLRRRRRCDVLRPDRRVDVDIGPGAHVAVRRKGVIEALPRDRDTWMVIDDKPWFFALTDQVSRGGRGVLAEAGTLATR